MFVTESNVTLKDDVTRTDLFVGLNFETPNVFHESQRLSQQALGRRYFFPAQNRLFPE